MYIQEKRNIKHVVIKSIIFFFAKVQVNTYIYEIPCEMVVRFVDFLLTLIIMKRL